MSKHIDFVALYRTETSEGPIGLVVAPLDAVASASSLEDLKGRTTIFKCGQLKKVPGGHYTAPGDIERGRVISLAVKAMAFQGMANAPEEMLAFWQGEDLLLDDHLERERAEKKARSSKVLEREVDAIAEVIAKIPHRHRHSVLSSLSRRIYDAALQKDAR